MRPVVIVVVLLLVSAASFPPVVAAAAVPDRVEHVSVRGVEEGTKVFTHDVLLRIYSTGKKATVDPAVPSLGAFDRDSADVVHWWGRLPQLPQPALMAAAAKGDTKEIYRLLEVGAPVVRAAPGSLRSPPPYCRCGDVCVQAVSATTTACVPGIL